MQRWYNSDCPNRSIVVCTHGTVCSFSPTLSKHGLTMGESVARARSLAPNAKFLLRDRAIEIAVRDRILSRLYTFTPKILALDEQGIGEKSIDSIWILLDNPLKPLQTFADKINARIGIGSHRSWAMLAALHSGPGRTTRVPQTMTEPFLQQAPVALLGSLGFGNDLIEKLLLFGLKAVGHLLYLTKHHLSAQFGKEGEKLFVFLHPPKSESPIPNYNPRIAETSFDFDWPVFEPHELQPALRILLERLLSRLNGQNVRYIEIRLQGRHGRVRETSLILKDPCSHFSLLFRAAKSLLQRALAQDSSRQQAMSCGQAVESISLILSGITEQLTQQAELFARQPKIHTIAKSANFRFPGKIVRPIQIDTNPFFPEEEYRFEPIVR